ncbi:hypothetical protein UPYG_G00154590 [Umbra pygmaea]|uniref:Ephrin RBD domain-containing protein n=1 Tax=Umbra pygmaea TaxID=75934 RepID=A0ABD0WXU9_UMBPY
MGCQWSPGAVTVWRITVMFNFACTVFAKRHEVYWNSTNSRLSGGDLSILVELNDYLDVYCPHYPALSLPGGDSAFQGPAENLALYLVAEEGFKGCVETPGAIKRWECNTPHAPFGPVRFSEKIQRFTPFSLGFEFVPGRHYFYSSLPTGENSNLPCMKLRVTVCCEPKTKESTQESGSPAFHNAVTSVRTAAVPLHLIPLLHFLSI